MASSVNPVIVLQQIPVLNVRGTHDTVGFAIGRTFKSLIYDAIEKFDFLEELLVPKYEKPEGRLVYDHSLQLCKHKFPGYVQELEGIARGSGIPFHRLFLLHIDNIILSQDEFESILWEAKTETGCTSLLSYQNELQNVVLGHTEDASRALRNNVFIVQAEIQNEVGSIIERFSTLTYAGYIPGGTMGYNHHGVVHSINTLVPTRIDPKATPVTFIMRALLNAASESEVLNILKDSGTGSADGFSVNLIVVQKNEKSLVRNIEVAPGSHESDLDILRIEQGESYAHCNKYLRLNVAQDLERIKGSVCRHAAIDKHPRNYNESTVKEILSDRSNAEFPVFRDEISQKDFGITAAVGIFNISDRSWSLYTGLPKDSEPVVVLPLKFSF